jgi:hypothetical protein
LALQWPKPAAQAAAGTTQAPAWQVTMAGAATLASLVQSCPQLPQFRGSVGVPQGPSGGAASGGGGGG